MKSNAEMGNKLSITDRAAKKSTKKTICFVHTQRSAMEIATNNTRIFSPQM